MAIQQPLKKRQGPLAMLGTAVLLAAVIFAAWYAIPRKQAPAGSLRFFSDDDGATWFADDATKIPPFNHNGKEAVLAIVYETRGGKQFVAYLEKFTDDAKATRNQATPSPHPGVAILKNVPHTSGLLVKKPHQGTWIPQEDPAAKEVRTFSPPDGSTDYWPATPE